ncbi:hypothetical protein ACWDR1_29480 [Streptosporangium sandarakinum]
MNPGKQNGAQAITPERRLNDQMAANDIPKVQPQADTRTNRGGQTSLPVVAAVAYPPILGMKRALLLVEHCPFCGEWHRHECEWPAPSLMKKRARCGASYDVMPYRAKATRRGRRAA